MTSEAMRDDDKPFTVDLDEALEIIKSTRGMPFVDRFRALGLDPETDFAGGDWRNCDFSRSDLSGVDFRNSRLFFANFRQSLVRGADFRGAGDVHTAKIHLSIGWRDALFDDYQIVLIESNLETMREHFAKEAVLRRKSMNDKEWFYAIKACPSFSEAKMVLEQMEASGHRFSPYAYSYVLDRAKRDHKQEDGWALFKYFLSESGVPDEALYTAGIGVAPDSKSALDVFDAMRSEMEGHGTIPGERAYNMAISKQEDNFTVALALFHEMKRKQVPIGRYTIYALFDSCQSFANAVTTLMEARRAGVDINDESFVDELNNATRYPELGAWNIRSWQAEGLSHREVIGRLVEQILRDPFRREALDALGLKPTQPGI